MSWGDAKEKIVTISVFTGIFLPLRFLFYSFVSEHWLGSFGLMTAVLVALIYFSKKGKLGWLGQVIMRQVHRISKGKVGKVMIIMSLILVYFFGNMIYGMETSEPVIKQRYFGELQKQDITDLESLKEYQDSQQVPMDPLLSIYLLLVLILPNPLGHATFAVINDMTSNWLLHLLTVFFIEQLEGLGILVYFRYVEKKLK